MRTAMLLWNRWDEKWEMEEVKVDAKKRIILPEDVRRKSGVRTGSKLKVSIKDGSIILTKSISPQQFIERMEGSLRDDSPVQVSDPLKLKEIWPTF
jgi:AbrB family looped-hinge helix DNA binding protein